VSAWYCLFDVWNDKHIVVPNAIAMFCLKAWGRLGEGLGIGYKYALLVLLICMLLMFLSKPLNPPREAAGQTALMPAVHDEWKLT
jgi:hypothetical protein